MISNGSSAQKNCSFFSDSYRLYPKIFLKQSFQNAARSLTLEAGKSMAPMQYVSNGRQYDLTSPSLTISSAVLQ